MGRATEKLKMLLPLCPLPAPMTACVAGDIRVSMTPCTVDLTAGPKLKVVPPHNFDSPWVLMFPPDKLLPVILKGGVLWLLELAWQSPVEGNAAAETMPSVVRRVPPVAGLPDIRVAGPGHHGHRLAFLRADLAAAHWPLGHYNPWGAAKLVSQTLH